MGGQTTTSKQYSNYCLMNYFVIIKTEKRRLARVTNCNCIHPDVTKAEIYIY